MPVYPDTTPVEVERTMTVAEDGARASVFTLQSHAGTHIDAPCHMRDGAPCLEGFDVEDFHFDAVRVDCTDYGARDPITVDALPDAAVAAGADLLAFATGWDEHWGTERYRDHPYLTGEAASWCAERDCAVGVDGFSPDPTPSADLDRERDSEPETYAAHDAMFAEDQFIVENLTNLRSLPDSFELHAYPLKVTGGDGSPIRAVAEY